MIQVYLRYGCDRRSRSKDHPPVMNQILQAVCHDVQCSGVDGVFMEVHDNPREAKSDGSNALESTKMRGVLKELLAVRKALAEVRATP